MPNRRKRTPQQIETAILTQSRRRCCLCWGLRSDAAEQQGQIAHIDHDPSNWLPENLVFLCLSHHNEYDSRMSQAKGLTAGEIREYRDRMYELLKDDTIPLAGVGSNQQGATQHGAPLCVVHGDGAAITNIQGNVNIRYPRSAKGKQATVIPGTVAEDYSMVNYLNYLINRYNEFKKWEAGQRMNYAMIRVAYQREFGCCVKDTPQVRFLAAAEYLQGRIRNTKLGRMKNAEGKSLFSSVDEFKQDRC